MSWERYRRRKTVIDAVLDAAARERADEIPARFEAAIRTEFDSAEAFLLALHYRWQQALEVRAELALERSGDGAERARAELIAEQPALHAILLRHADDPALIAADAWYLRQHRYALDDTAHPPSTCHGIPAPVR